MAVTSIQQGVHVRSSTRSGLRFKLHLFWGERSNLNLDPIARKVIEFVLIYGND